MSVLQDAAGTPLLLQTKEAGRSVLEEHGGNELPPQLSEVIAEGGRGARVVALQRILQGASDPFLGYFVGNGRRLLRAPVPRCWSGPTPTPSSPAPATTRSSPPAADGRGRRARALPGIRASLLPTGRYVIRPATRRRP
nr:DUF2252 family protein [Microbacterium aurum]